MGLFPRGAWLTLLGEAGFTPLVIPLEHARSDLAVHDVFLGLRPQPGERT
jgi:hypothetical protein